MNQPRLFYSKTDYFSKVLLYMWVYTCNNKIIFTSLSLPLPDCEWAVMAYISSISLYPLSFSLSLSLSLSLSPCWPVSGQWRLPPALSLSLSHLAGLWVGSEGLHQLWGPGHLLLSRGERPLDDGDVGGVDDLFTCEPHSGPFQGLLLYTLQICKDNPVYTAENRVHVISPFFI